MTLPLNDMGVTLQERLADYYERACRVELEVIKPGNVSVHGAAYGMCAEDFIHSAEASAGALIRLESGIGERIYQAVVATREAVSSNTNLGIILLAAPLMHSVMNRKFACPLRRSLHEALALTDVADASWAYKAIRLAAPGGLGRSQKHDIYEEPEVSLLEAMHSAAQRDRIAYQYASDYEDVVEFMLPCLHASRSRYDNERRAVLEIYLETLARVPDSHIERKHGEQAARHVSTVASDLLAELKRAGDTERFRENLKQADRTLKSAGLNPGATADLTVATLLFDYLEANLW